MHSPIPTLFFALLFLLNICKALPNPQTKALQKRSIVRGQIEYYGCYDNEVNILQDHFRDVEAMATEAMNQAYKGNRYFDAFFGTLPNSAAQPSDADIKSRFAALSKIQSTPNQRPGTNGWHRIRCDADTQPRCQKSGFGAPMATSLNSGEMWVCNSYWRSPQKLSQLSPPTRRMGTQPLDEYSPHGGLILHELTHAIWLTNDMTLKKKNGEVMYGHENDLRGTSETAGYRKTRMNADNYRMFATAAYWSAKRGTVWSVNPDRLYGDDSGFKREI